jgi:hypothetical protein
VSARSDTEIKPSESEGARIERLETMLSALLSQKLGPDLFFTPPPKYQIESPKHKPNCTYNKTEGNSWGPNCNLFSDFNQNNYLTIGLSIINKAQNYTKWVLDSGTTDHMTGNQTL